MQQRLQDFAMRLQAQGIPPDQYFQATGQDQAAFAEDLKNLSEQGVKADLALRAVADAESIEVTDDDLDEEFERLAQRVNQKATKLRQEFERADQISAVRSDIRKRKALDWLAEQVELVDEQGEPIERSALELPADEADDDNDEQLEPE
jgi:trigger factor